MQRAMLVTRVGAVACAFPIDQVIETMRPLPVEPIGSAGAAIAHVAGAAIIRGAPVPVVDVRKLLGVTPAARTARFVVVRAGARQIALVVDEVVEVAQLSVDDSARLPALLGGADRDAVSALTARDRELMIVLDAARVLGEASLRALEAVDAGDRGGNA